MPVLDRLDPVETRRVEVGAGAEVTTGPGDDQDPLLRLLEVVQSSRQLLPTVERDGVLPLRAVDGQPSHPFPILDVEPAHHDDGRPAG